MGLEDLLANEIKQLGGQDISIQKRAVRFEGNLEILYRVNYFSYLALDILVALLLAGGVRGHGTLAWTVLVLGFLSAGVYNFLVCDYQADRIDEFA